jgi:hypothetical protein
VTGCAARGDGAGASVGGGIGERGERHGGSGGGWRRRPPPQRASPQLPAHV